MNNFASGTDEFYTPDPKIMEQYYSRTPNELAPWPNRTIGDMLRDYWEVSTPYEKRWDAFELGSSLFDPQLMGAKALMAMPFAALTKPQAIVRVLKSGGLAAGEASGAPKLQALLGQKLMGMLKAIGKSPEELLGPITDIRINPRLVRVVGGKLQRVPIASYWNRPRADIEVYPFGIQNVRNPSSGEMDLFHELGHGYQEAFMPEFWEFSGRAEDLLTRRFGREAAYAADPKESHAFMFETMLPAMKTDPLLPTHIETASDIGLRRAKGTLEQWLTGTDINELLGDFSWP